MHQTSHTETRFYDASQTEKRLNYSS